MIILGAGASASAKVPTMHEVYKYLYQEVANTRKRTEIENIDGSDMLLELENRLCALKDYEVPRSIVAMSLGTLQKAHEKEDQENVVYKYLAEVWHNFSKAFVHLDIPVENNVIPQDKKFPTSDAIKKMHTILSEYDSLIQFHSDISNEKIKEQKKSPENLHDLNPTKMHMLVAALVKANLAQVVSVNFDGLTRKAIDDNKYIGVVLGDPDKVEKHFLKKEQDNNDTLKESIPIIKVWGDVFHSICTNNGCPESNVRIPIFNLDKDNKENRCEVCTKKRQLQIFFTGYEEKEKSTNELMKVLIKHISPQIGNVITIGFSGLWDQSLVNFIGLLCSEIEQETKVFGNKIRIPCICIDTKETPPFLHEMNKRDVIPLHLKLRSNEFAELFNINTSKNDTSKNDTSKIFSHLSNYDEILPDQMWGEWIRGKKDLKELVLPATYPLITETSYLKSLEYLRQLGIKTKMSLVAARLDIEKVNEKNHNRLQHSHGAAHLAITWFNHLIKTIPVGIRPSEPEMKKLETIVLFASLHHDIGHLPFTHLAEEIFEEIHWTLKEWGEAFIHDDPVLASLYSDFNVDVDNTFKNAAEKINLDEHIFKSRVESAIQGCSGFAWIDAILNSPLDADKLDYIFRDCNYLDQGVHITRENKITWIDEFFNDTMVLPSGLVALGKISGGHACNFLEERIWLYKHQYNQPAFRCIERIARAVIIRWLLEKVPKKIFEEQKKKIGFINIIGDTSVKKGFAARDLLWYSLKNLGNSDNQDNIYNQDDIYNQDNQRELFNPRSYYNKNIGEPELLIKIVAELKEDIFDRKGLVYEWLERCEKIFKECFKWSQSSINSKSRNLLDLLSDVDITYSDLFYINHRHLKLVREIARKIETQHPFRALIDIAVLPRFLSYPSHRKHSWQKEKIISECFAVSHYDPDKWGQSTNKWIPMSESAFSEKDKNRNLRILIVSPYPNDPEVAYTVDIFRNYCRIEGIEVSDVDNSC